MSETAPTETPASDLVMSPPSMPVRLDLGGGQNVAPGFECVDLNAPNPAHRVDLFKFPWPFADNSVDELHCSHFIEHIPNREIAFSDILAGPSCKPEIVDEFVGKDMLFAFFDECWRIMKPLAWLHLTWPALRSVRAFQDPTHRRYIPTETMYYLASEWRKANRLDHYRVRCNFTGDLTNTAAADLSLFSPEVQQRWMTQYWNVLCDHQAKLQALK